VNPKSARHLALVYEVTMDSPDVTVHMQAEFKEFKEGRGKSVSGKFFEVTTIDPKFLSQMERWSMFLLRDFFGVRVPEVPEQASLFIS